MKGMVFVGCSFTHGHGLWTYGDFSGKPMDDNPPDDKIHAFMRYVQSKRFPRLVANHFGSWEFVRQDVSGDDDNSVGILNHMFHIDSPIKYTQEPIKFDYDDISHVIFQTSFIDRCPYILDKNGAERERITEIEESAQVDTLLDWGFTNIEDYYTELRAQWYGQIRKTFKILESNGIKCYILSITDDYSELMKDDDFIKDRFITLKYKNNEFQNFKELFDYDKSLKIINDFSSLKTPPIDEHPSLRCHEIVAKSIIDKIEKYG